MRNRARQNMKESKLEYKRKEAEIECELRE